MPEWRDKIIQRFQPAVARVTAVSDADGLLRDPGVFQAIQAKGFSIIQFEGPVSFRFDYESRFRTKWDAGETPELVVVFKPGEHEFETLPADVWSPHCRIIPAFNHPVQTGGRWQAQGGWEIAPTTCIFDALDDVPGRTAKRVLRHRRSRAYFKEGAWTADS